MNISPDAPKRPALRYYGGKWKLAPWIISHFPSHQNYVEPCGGAASVLLQKPPSLLETYNDIDGAVVNFFRVLRDNPAELVDRLLLTPWARAEYELSWEPHPDPIEWARRFFVHGYMSFNGTANNKSGGSWLVQKDYDMRGIMPSESKIKTVQELRRIAERLATVQIENRDALEVIGRYDTPWTLFYFDPPYPAETRSHKNEYTYEATTDFHRRAAISLQNVEGYAVISGYMCPLYVELYQAPGWKRVDKEAQTNSGGRRIESLWLSPRTVEALQVPVQAELFSVAP